MMNKKLEQFFLAVKGKNFIDTVSFSQIYHSSDVTQEDKDAFLAWIHDNDLEIIDGRDRGCFVFKKKGADGWLDHGELDKLIPDISKERLKQIADKKETATCARKTARIILDREENPKKSYLIDHIFSKIFSSKHPSGWLHPNGQMEECNWGEHEEWAGQYIQENELVDEQEKFEDVSGLYYNKDFLIFEKRFVLLDCPSGDGTLSVSYKKGSLTKAQKEYLIEHFLSIGDKKSLEQIME